MSHSSRVLENTPSLLSHWSTCVWNKKDGEMLPQSCQRIHIFLKINIEPWCALNQFFFFKFHIIQIYFNEVLQTWIGAIYLEALMVPMVTWLSSNWAIMSSAPAIMKVSLPWWGERWKSVFCHKLIICKWNGIILGHTHTFSQIWKFLCPWTINDTLIKSLNLYKMKQYLTHWIILFPTWFPMWLHCWL